MLCATLGGDKWQEQKKVFLIQCCHNQTKPYITHRLCLTLAFVLGVSCVICHWSGVQWCRHMENTTMRSPECLSQMD